MLRSVPLSIGIVTVVLAASSASSQAPSSLPAFPTQAALITVDVVVLDKRGEPVRGLSAADFTVSEAGRPQSIVAFEAREMPPAPLDAPRPARAAAAERVVSNLEPKVVAGRVLAILVDDLGLTPAVAEELKPALQRWMLERAAPTDEITILTTSGDVWWSDQAGRGREDLSAVVERIKPKALAQSARDPMVTDAEAYEIAVNGSPSQAGDTAPQYETNSRGEKQTDLARPEPAGVGPPPPVLDDRGPAALARSATVLDRVAKRFLDQGLCQLIPRPPLPPMWQCEGLAKSSAQVAYASWTRRAQAVLASLEALSRDFGSLPGRKGILLVSEAFLRDQQFERDYRRVADGAQRSNTSLYFSSARGLSGMSTFEVDTRAALRPGDVTVVNTETQILERAGGEHLAEATGGVAVAGSNDLASGLERMAADSTAYYLLGYAPQRTPDGSFRKLEVKVTRPGLTVRARRGYVASAAADPLPASPRPTRKAGRKEKAQGGATVDLLAGGSRAQVPMRLASYVQGPDVAGAVRVLVTVEVDGRRLAASEGTVTFDLAIVGVPRDDSRVLPLLQEVEMKIGARDTRDWWALFREIRLPPGVAQVRAMVRDRATGALGTVSQRIEVPRTDGPWLSTPMLTRSTQPPLREGEPPRLVPTASRRFHVKDEIFCQYELFGFGGLSLPGVARVRGGYSLTGEDGSVLVSAPPTPIVTDGTRVVRRVALPVESLQPGTYELVLTVEDQLAQRTLSAREAFTLEAAPPD